MMLAAAFFAVSYLTIKHLTAKFAIFELVFYRTLIGALVMAPLVWSSGSAGFATARLPLYAARSAITCLGMLTWFYGLAHLPLADATALIFTTPFFTIALVAIWLNERVYWYRWAATACGLLGALIIVRPGFVEFHIASLAVMVTAASYGGSNAMTRALAGTENPNTSVFYLFVLIVPIMAIPTAIWFTPPALADAPWILALGLLSAGAQQCITRSLSIAPASAVEPFAFLQLPFVALLGFALFGEVPEIWIWIGAAIIFTSAYAVARRDARRARRT